MYPHHIRVLEDRRGWDLSYITQDDRQNHGYNHDDEEDGDDYASGGYDDHRYKMVK